MEKDNLLNELKKIEKWEKEQDDLWFWEKLGKIPFTILDKITPKFIHNKINVVIDELSKYITTGGSYLINKKSILKRFENINSIDDIKELSLEEMDKACDNLISMKKNIAAAQGATTGFGGFITLAIDIPAVLGLSLNALQEIAICYGYDPHDEKERLFIIKCLQFSSSDIIGKQTILKEIIDFDKSDGSTNAISQVKSWREVMTAYRDSYGWKKMFQMVPIAGMLFGAYLNRKAIEDVSEVGKMLYKKRRIMKILKDGNNENN